MSSELDNFLLTAAGFQDALATFFLLKSCPVSPTRITTIIAIDDAKEGEKCG